MAGRKAWNNKRRSWHKLAYRLGRSLWRALSLARDRRDIDDARKFAALLDQVDARWAVPG